MGALGCEMGRTDKKAAIIPEDSEGRVVPIEKQQVEVQ